MPKIFHIFLTLLLVLSGCTTTPKQDITPTQIWPPARYYEEGKRALDAADYDTAILRYGELATQYPNSAYTPQVKLETAYAYFKRGDTDKALLAVNDFIDNYSTHSHFSYALYLRGLISFQAGVDRLRAATPGAPKPEDSALAREAFASLTELTSRYPNSPYTRQATQYMVLIHEGLAQYHTAQAKYSLEHNDYLGAAQRAKYVADNFPNTTAAVDALGVLAVAYKLQELDDLSNQALQRLEQLDPDHPAIPQVRGRAPTTMPSSAPTQPAGTSTEIPTSDPPSNTAPPNIDDKQAATRADSTSAPAPSSAVNTTLVAADEEQRAPDSLAQDGVVQTPEWLLQQDPHSYTIQLLTTTRLTALERYVAMHNLESPSAYFPTTSDNRTRFVLVRGVYPTITDARNAIEALPAEISKTRPWIRNMAVIHRLIREEEARPDEPAVTPEPKATFDAH